MQQTKLSSKNSFIKKLKENLNQNRLHLFNYFVHGKQKSQTSQVLPHFFSFFAKLIFVIPVLYRCRKIDVVAQE